MRVTRSASWPLYGSPGREHMTFNGSLHFKLGRLVEYFQSIGMNSGADANAHTVIFKGAAARRRI